MSVSGIQAAAEINLDEFERRLRSPGSQQASAEDLLAALVRLIDSSGPLRKRSPTAVSMLGQTDAEPPQPLEMATLPPLVDLAPDERTGTASVYIEAPLASKFGNAYLPGGWTLKISALALAAGAVLVGAAFGLEGGAPGQPKGPPFVAAAVGSTNAPQRNGGDVATLSDAGAIPLKDITQPAAVKGVTSEQQIELGDHAAIGNAAPSANLAPTSAGAAQPIARVSSGPRVAVAVNTPVEAAPFVAPPPAAPQYPDPKAVRTVSLQPDGAQFATATPSATDSGETVHANDAPQGPAKTAPKGASEAAGVARPSTHKLDLPTKLSRKPSARIVVAKTETAALGPEAEKAPEVPPAPSQQPVNPLSHASSYIVGAPRVPAASAPQPVDRTAAYKSGDWAIQLGAQKSEAEAEVKAARLNTKYPAALNGATIGINKTLVNGEIIYALRVAGLSKADASALCVRLSGHDCLTAK